MKKESTSGKNLPVKCALFFLAIVCATALTAQQPSRLILKINEDWLFIKGADTSGKQWQQISLPHTWNVDDVLDDEPGYYRGISWYKKNIRTGSEFSNKELTLYFEGANQEAEIFVNGKNAGRHVGGYTAFSMNVTRYIQFNQSNEIIVKLDNSHNRNIAPLTADFSFYGGIYRDVFLRVTNKIHFAPDEGSTGIYITTPHVSKEKATVRIRSVVRNNSVAVSDVYIISRILDAGGRLLAQEKTLAKLGASSVKSVSQLIPAINTPKLWSPEQPYLYTVETKITDISGKVLDVMVNPLGFRWFRFDAKKGFFLNGQPYKLVGASRHQDYKGLGNAVPDEIAVEDVVLLKKMGANFLRVAHYPQDPCVLKACDSLGLLASVEIPVVNEITESDSFYRNCQQMQREMIRQNFNHPSVVIWCYMNEILLKTPFDSDRERRKVYLSKVASLAKRLDDAARKEDPFRYTMMAHHGSLAQYKNAGLLNIPMITGWNLYSGWYGGSMEDFPLFLDRFHKEYPDMPFMVTEYGADADPRIRSMQPVRFDKSVEYTTRFHQYYFTEMMKRPYVAGAIVWNLADFNSETRNETMPHINNKGLMEWNRRPKDPYYFYQAVLSEKPFIKILGSCQNKFGIADSNLAVCYKLLQVATNFDSVFVILNGAQQIVLKVNNGLCEWKLPFREGLNSVVAEGRKNGRVFSDSIQTEIHLQPSCLTDKQIPFKEINIMLGSARYFIDEKGEWWQPDQAYQKGRWGSIGGKSFRIENNAWLPYGTDKNIIGTNNDPVYQTQQTGIRQYRLDVPPGKYELTFHFAELLGGKARILPYNLNGKEREDKNEKRIFTVHVNGQTILDQFNIAEDYGIAKAVVKSATVMVNDAEGILVDFMPVKGETVLNALQLKKLE